VANVLRDIDRIKNAIEKAASNANIHPRQVTKTQIFETDSEISDWMIRKAGGISAIKNNFAITTKDLAEIQSYKDVNKYIASLEKRVAQKELFEKEVKEKINSLLTPIKVKPYKANRKASKLKRENVVMLNDVHYGLIVNPDEVGGSNKFSWTEACRRTAFLTKQVCEYKLDKRNEVDRLHVILNGDMLQGVIHDLTARTAELLIHQVNGAVHILGYMISNLATNYREVVVHGVSGNHDDAHHRREGGRVLSHKYDSYTNMVYFALSAMFKDQPNVKFDFPKNLYGAVDLPNGRIIYTHGDTMFSSELGNPGKSLNTKSLGDSLSRFNSGEIDKNNPKAKMFLFGHVHSHAEFTAFDGTKVMIAPSLSGVDSFAASLAINHNQIGQLLFESTSEYIAGDKRLIELLKADKDESLDKIIPIFKNKLSWMK